MDLRHSLKAVVVIYHKRLFTPIVIPIYHDEKAQINCKSFENCHHIITDTTSKFLEIIPIDMFYHNTKNYLTIVNAFSKFAQAIKISWLTYVTV